MNFAFLLTKVAFFFDHFFFFRQGFKNLKIIHFCCFNKKLQNIFHKVIKILKDSVAFLYSFLIDIFGVDFLGFEKYAFFNGFSLFNLCFALFRYAVVYLFRSFKYFDSLCIYLYFEANFFIYSLVYLFKGAAWLERECFDLFGFFFIKNKDLRRLLTDYGFKGHPLLKNFPLVGYYEIAYNSELSCILYESIFLFQSYRKFFINKNWNKAVGLPQLFEINSNVKISFNNFEFLFYLYFFVNRSGCAVRC